MSHILLVDDDEQFRYTAQQMLELDQHHVTSLASAEAALEKLKQGGNWDLIITDICMPGMDGLEFLRLIQKKYPIPVIVISGGGQRALHRDFALQSAKMIGAMHTLEKPLRLQTLRDTVQQAIR